MSIEPGYSGQKFMPEAFERLRRLRELLPEAMQLQVDGGVNHENIAAAREAGAKDRKSTRLNSSHSQISYAVFCLKKKKHMRTDAHAWWSADETPDISHTTCAPSFSVASSNFRTTYCSISSIATCATIVCASDSR